MAAVVDNESQHLVAPKIADDAPHCAFGEVEGVAISSTLEEGQEAM